MSTAKEAMAPSPPAPQPVPETKTEKQGAASDVIYRVWVDAISVAVQALLPTASVAAVAIQDSRHDVKEDGDETKTSGREFPTDSSARSACIPVGRVRGIWTAGLVSLCVHKSYRSRGVGTRLMQYYEQAMWRHTAASRIVFTCARENARAIALYARLGYEVRNPSAVADAKDESMIDDVVCVKPRGATATAAMEELALPAPEFLDARIDTVNVPLLCAVSEDLVQL